MSIKPETRKKSRKGSTLLIVGVIISLMICSLSACGKSEKEKPKEVTTKSAVTAAAGSTTAAAEEKPDLEYERFMMIKAGMDYNSIKDLIGFDGEQNVLTSVPENGYIDVDWDGKNDKHIVVRIKDGVMYSKSQSNLAERKEVVTLEQYTQLQPGMSYDNAVQIMGVDGVLVSESYVDGGTYQQYEWYGKEPFSMVTADFKDAALTESTQHGLK